MATDATSGIKTLELGEVWDLRDMRLVVTVNGKPIKLAVGDVILDAAYPCSYRTGKDPIDVRVTLKLIPDWRIE